MPNPLAMTASSGRVLPGRLWRTTGRRDSETLALSLQFLLVLSSVTFVTLCLAQAKEEREKEAGCMVAERG